MKIVFLTGALCLGLAQPLVAQTPNAQPQGDPLSRATFFDLGLTLLRDNKVQDAANVADSLLATRPNDASALILRAEAAISLGDFEGGANYAAKAYRFATSNAQKFGAARLVALAHAQLKQDTRAQLWLRRARQFSPDQQAADGIAKDYAFLRDRNPWATSLRFGLQPSSNVNNGSAKSSSLLLGLPLEFSISGDGRALSGWMISGGFDVEYRLNTTKTSATFATLSADYRTYLLSKAAQIQAPNVLGRDFADGTLSFGITHKQIFSEGSKPTEFSLKAAKVSYGGAPYSEYLDARISQSWDIGSSNGVSLSLSRQSRLNAIETKPVLSQIDGISVRWFHQLANRDNLALGAFVNKSTSDDFDSTFDTVGYSLTYSPSRPVFGVGLGITLDTETRNFDSFALAGGQPREDKAVGLNVSMVFSNIEYYGFQPVVNLSARRNESTLDVFDRDYASVGFDLRSSF